MQGQHQCEKQSEQQNEGYILLRVLPKNYVQINPFGDIIR